MLITFILLFVNLSLIIGKTIEQFTKCYCIGYLALVLILCFETVQVANCTSQNLLCGDLTDISFIYLLQPESPGLDYCILP